MSSRVRLGDPQHYRQRFIDGGHDPDGHLRRGVPVAGANAIPAVDLGMALRSCPISSSITRWGMPASSSQVENV
jgi:hypothetical protein